jgi:vacuolar-type H+-ATPase subunit I/STV1
MKKVQKTNPPDHMPDKYEKEALQGYQSYPESEDIYNKFREEENLDPEDISKVKKTDKSENAPKNKGKESNDDEFGRNLDVPGSELDDEQENVGNEDEENNYYSIGGDEHNNLDEDKDELL